MLKPLQQKRSLNNQNLPEKEAIVIIVTQFRIQITNEIHAKLIKS